MSAKQEFKRIFVRATNAAHYKRRFPVVSEFFGLVDSAMQLEEERKKNEERVQEYDPQWCAGYFTGWHWRRLHMGEQHCIGVMLAHLMQKGEKMVGKVQIKTQKDEVPSFPETLYVQESFGGPAVAHPFEGYRGYNDTEEGDTVAVYQLQKVCRVRVKSERILEEKPSGV